MSTTNKWTLLVKKKPTKAEKKQVRELAEKKEIEQYRARRATKDQYLDVYARAYPNGFPENYREEFEHKPFPYDKLPKVLKYYIFEKIVKMYKVPVYNTYKIEQICKRWYYWIQNINVQVNLWPPTNFHATQCLVNEMKCRPTKATVAKFVLVAPPPSDEDPSPSTYTSFFLHRFKFETWTNMPIPTIEDMKNHFMNFGSIMSETMDRGEATIKFMYGLLMDYREKTSDWAPFQLNEIEPECVRSLCQSVSDGKVSEEFAMWCIEQDWFPKTTYVVSDMLHFKFSARNISKVLNMMLNIPTNRKRFLGGSRRKITFITFLADESLDDEFNYYVFEHVFHTFMELFSINNIGSLPTGYFEIYKDCLRIAHPHLIKLQLKAVLDIAPLKYYRTFEDIFYSLRERISISTIYCPSWYKSKYQFRMYNEEIYIAEQRAQRKAFLEWKAPINNRKKERLMNIRSQKVYDSWMYDNLNDSSDENDYYDRDYECERDLDDPECLDAYDTEPEDLLED